MSSVLLFCENGDRWCGRLVGYLDRVQLPERYKETKQKYERGNHVGCLFSSFCFEPVRHDESLHHRAVCEAEIDKVREVIPNEGMLPYRTFPVR
jgi:hypothetical protein